MLNEFSKKESPIQGLAGFGGGALSKSILSSAVTKVITPPEQLLTILI